MDQDHGCDGAVKEGPSSGSRWRAIHLLPQAGEVKSLHPSRLRDGSTALRKQSVG
jgi:hypothetical protein